MSTGVRNVTAEQDIRSIGAVEECADGDALIVRVRDSRFDKRSAPLVWGRLRTLIRDGHRRVAFEMSSVEFIDSSGLGVLVLAEQKLGVHGGFVISSPSNTVMSILRLTRLAKVFRIFANERQAIAALHG
jgi:anti-sigma B factor antagonist